jgi:hypothetical protein
MSAAKLIKLVPMLILVAFLAYAGYSIHASADDPAEDPSAQVKDPDTGVQENVTAGNAVEGDRAGVLRDPFQVVVEPSAVAGARQSPDDASSGPDVLAEIVQGLKLDGTFLQGRIQMAIINGRVYSKGEHVRIDARSDKFLAPLVLVGVLPAKVTLRGGDRDYVLGYPDQAIPSNKPIGAVGKSMIGSQAAISAHSDPAPRTRHSRGSRTGHP